MGKIRYIGSKARIAGEILDYIGPPYPGAGRFVDLFSGTGSVSRAAAIMGWEVLANDYLLSSAAMTTAQLLSAADVPFEEFGGYAPALEQLAEAKPVEGFIYREYAPSGLSRTGHERRYFTVENARRIDGMRQCIERWHSRRLIGEHEKTLLIADVLSAANTVANIAGTYGCFLSHWHKSALRASTPTARELLPSHSGFTVLHVDAFKLSVRPSDVVYLDPPYTKRQYAAYYHILETIAAGDSPTVEGVTGLRPWKDKLSPFCYKMRALHALERLVAGIGASRIVLSYSSEGHMALPAVQSMLRRFGEVSVHHLSEIGRYRPNQRASEARAAVTEFLVDLAKAPQHQEASP
jgi:adenine-specific DNA-methyltransferase